MGPKQSAERKQFLKTNIPCNTSQFFHQCRHCIDANATDGSVVVENIIGRHDNFKKHLSTCQHALNASSPASSQPNDTEHREQDATDPLPLRDFTPQEILDFHEALLEFQADNQLPDTFVGRSSTKRVFQLINASAAAVLPTRRQLGGRLLSDYAKKVSHQDTNALRQLQIRSGGRVNFLSDVRQNIVKTHLLGCQLALHGSNTTIGLYPTGSEHDGLALAKQMEAIMVAIEADGWKLGAVVTDNAGQCVRARRILALRWPNVAFLICFAHDVNNLVKAVLRSTFREVTAQASAVVNVINASSSKWLKRARDCMEETYGLHKALRPLCETRWNSMQACFASLLRMRCALEVFAVKYRDHDSFPTSLAVLEDRGFWEKLHDAERVVRPLCFVSFKLQADENTLADIVLCFRDIYDGFVTSVYRSELVILIENRWKACEQPLIMLALFLHPAYTEDARALPSTNVSSLANICRFAIFHFKQFIGGESGSLRGDIADWTQGEFIDASLGDFANGSIPPVPAFWRFAKLVKPKSVLPDLAMVILSIVVNTATCERYFSELALIHSARRNRMSPDKARRISVVRKHVRERNHRSGSKKDTTVVPPKRRVVNTNEPQKLATYGTPNRSRINARSAFFCVHEVSRASEPHQRTPATVDASDESDGNFDDNSDEDAEGADDGDNAVDADGAGGAGGFNNSDGFDNSDGAEYAFSDGEDPLNHWETIFSELVANDDDFPDEDLLMDDDCCTDGGIRGVQYRERHPIPDFNDTKFPQETDLCELRSQKATLQELFMLSSHQTIRQELSF